MDSFEGRVAVVTGAASGIGRGLADHFAAQGMKVVLADIEQEALDATADAVASTGADVLAVRVDVADGDSVDALADAAYECYGAVHVVCNNAGVGGGGPVAELTANDWQWVIGVNLWGVIHGLRAFLPRMIAGDDEGHIVNTASMAGMMAGPMMAPYNATKFAVVAISETLHAELAMTTPKIGVSVLCPGFVNTNIMESERNRPAGLEGRAFEPDPGMRAAFKAMLESGKQPAEVAEIVADAIRARRLHVFTDGEFRPAFETRVQTILDAFPKD